MPAAEPEVPSRDRQHLDLALAAQPGAREATQRVRHPVSGEIGVLVDLASTSAPHRAYAASLTDRPSADHRAECLCLRRYPFRSSSASASEGVEKRKRERAACASRVSTLGPTAWAMSGRVRMAKAR